MILWVLLAFAAVGVVLYLTNRRHRHDRPWARMERLRQEQLNEESKPGQVGDPPGNRESGSGWPGSM